MPDWGEPVRRRLAELKLPGERESEIVEELTAHLDQRYADLLAAGQPEFSALRSALKELEGRDVLAGKLRHSRLPAAGEPVALGSGKGRFMSGFWHDLKVAVRMMLLKPSFSAMAIGMLALGIAGNTAIFSIFNGLALRPLPVHEAERLVDLDERAPKWNLQYVSICNLDFYTWQKNTAAFDGIAAYDSSAANLAGDHGLLQRIRLAQTTYNFLNVLGLKPEIGRSFLPEEDRPGGAKVILLEHHLWQTLFHGDRSVLGSVVKLDEKPYRIVGVLPPEAVEPSNVEAWIPLAADPAIGNSFHLNSIGRLKRGVSIEQASADLLRNHKAQIQIANRKVNQETFPIITPLRERELGDFMGIARVLLGAVGLVLLIACVNIAGLMLVRAEARSREMAIRVAVGASRSRIIRQLLSESLLLAIAGGAIGVVLGKLCLNALTSMIPDQIPTWVRFDLDWRFALFSVAVTGAAAIFFGLAPALQAASADTRGCLQELGRTTQSRGRRRTLNAMVVCEVALALILLTSSSLLIEAFRKVLRTDPGFRTQNVIAWGIRLPEATYPKAPQQFQYFHTLIDRLRAIPGVRSASAASLIPLSGHTGSFFEAADKPLGPKDQSPVVLTVTALPGYFDTMGISFLKGRPFDERDESAKAPSTVIVNETFAKYFWPGQDALGKRIRYTGGKDLYQVVGVTRDTKHYGLDQEMKPGVFFPFRENPGPSMGVVVRGSSDVAGLLPPAREVMRQLDPDLAMFDVRTMTERLNRSLWQRRVYSWLFAAFAMVAILLAAAGIYGVISFAVSQRTREIGIRMALGARPGQVLRGVLASGMTLVCGGVAIGLGASLLSAGLLKTMLFGVSKHDVVTYSVVIAGVILVGLGANYLPARRAASVEPTRALRFE